MEQQNKKKQQIQQNNNVSKVTGATKKNQDRRNKSHKASYFYASYFDFTKT